MVGIFRSGMPSVLLHSMTTNQRRLVCIAIITVVAIICWEARYGAKISNTSPKGVTDRDIFKDVLKNMSRNGVDLENDDGSIQDVLSDKQGTANIVVFPKQTVLENYTISDTLNISESIKSQWRDKPHKAYWVGVDAPFMQRIAAYNKAIGDLRKKIKHKRGFKNFVDPSTNPTVIWGSVDDFLERLSNFTEILTVSLTWLQSSASRNLLVSQYYEWVGSEPLCTWIRTVGFTKARWDAVYNRMCTTDSSVAEAPKTNLEPLYLHGKPINPEHYWPHNGNSYPAHFYTRPPPHVLYLHIIQDAVITSVGHIFTGRVKVVPYSCNHDRSPDMPNGYAQMPIYAEVFTMSGSWGTAHFHKSIELLPRIAPYVDFLVENPQIMIHASETAGMTAELLEIIGISRDRLISGTRRAKITYMPQGTPCGFVQVQGGQILSHLYRNHIKQRVSKEQPQKPNLVVIHRSGARRLTEARYIEMSLKDLAEEFDLNFCIYHDQQLPSLADTMEMFNHAAIVVAPHGAGESNLLFCEPGTYVIEAVCNPPHVNMCFQRLAHVLGHRYHGIPSEDGCEDHISVNPKVLLFVVKTYVLQWKNQQANKVL